MKKGGNHSVAKEEIPLEVKTQERTEEGPLEESMMTGEDPLED